MAVNDIRKHLVRKGYADSLLVDNFLFDRDRQVRLAAFAQQPIDARSACLAVVEGNGDPTVSVLACRGMGAPLVLVCQPLALQCWKQTSDRPEKLGEFGPAALAKFFQDYDLSPESIYRAKIRGRFDLQYRLPFVDYALMPIVESEIGACLSDLVEHVVRQLRESLCPTIGKLTPQTGQRLVQSAFWLLAGKILHDKQVPSFKSLDLINVADVFYRVATHYGAAVRLQITRAEQKAFEAAAQQVDSLGHLGHVTTESLAYVYENALIDKETRTTLGTHSTPAYLVDYMVWQLASWIEDIPVADRHVFEPACGHAAFMVSAMRLLRELLPDNLQASRRQYLRTHLHGIEVDPFALEIARLSLTLADIPNPNGWDLNRGDMFQHRTLEQCAQKSMILLTNPPFEDFLSSERKAYERGGVTLKNFNKTTETLLRTLPALRQGAVIGVVMPQGLLHSRHAADLRRLFAAEFELAEICLFPDGIFTFSDAESAIILGRKARPAQTRTSVRYARVREKDRERFKHSYTVTTEQSIWQSRFAEGPDWDMRIPDLEPIWQSFRALPKLDDVAQVGQGLSYIGAEKLPRGSQTISRVRFKGAVRGFARFARNMLIHEHPTQVWMNLDAALISAFRSGATTGIPQVLLNYARVSRGPWRLKAFIDRKGHAVTSRFLTVRARAFSCPLEFLWALCNSPVANAYVYAHSMRREILAGLMRQMPIPRVNDEDIRRIAEAARRYLAVVVPTSEILPPLLDERAARRLLLQLDAEMLRLYNLPPRAERQLLDLFAGGDRVGVPFRFHEYFAEDFEPCFSLYDCLSKEYEQSTAGELRSRQRDISSPSLLKAMRRAVDDYEE